MEIIPRLLIATLFLVATICMLSGCLEGTLSFTKAEGANKDAPNAPSTHGR